jgi:hypothetical protein
VISRWKQGEISVIYDFGPFLVFGANFAGEKNIINIIGFCNSSVIFQTLK